MISNLPENLPKMSANALKIHSPKSKTPTKPALLKKSHIAVSTKQHFLYYIIYLLEMIKYKYNFFCILILNYADIVLYLQI